MRIITTKPLPTSPLILTSVAYLFLFFTFVAILQMALTYRPDTWWLLPGIFGIFIYRGLLKHRLAWRNLALWIAVLGIISFLFLALAFILSLLDPLTPMLPDELDVPSQNQQTLPLWVSPPYAAACLWINYVLRRGDIRRLFVTNDGATENGVPNANPH